MKGIVLAGGSGTRWRPLTLAVSKQLLPVYDKPMIHYPLSTLMLAGLREILIVTTPEDAPGFQRLLGDGSAWGIALSFAVQDAPRGIADALRIGADFLGGSPCGLVLGDNLLHGEGLSARLRAGGALTSGARVFGYRVRDPRRYGVIAFDGDRPVDLIEKPAVPPSRWAVPGLYFYDGTASDRAAALRPSDRGELEITDLNRAYLADGALEVDRLGRGVAWLDMGTPASLLEASAYVEALQSRQGLRVGCPEEVAWRSGWIDDAGLAACARGLAGTDYGAYLEQLLREGP